MDDRIKPIKCFYFQVYWTSLQEYQVWEFSISNKGLFEQPTHWQSQHSYELYDHDVFMQILYSNKRKEITGYPTGRLVHTNRCSPLQHCFVSRLLLPPSQFPSLSLQDRIPANNPQAPHQDNARKLVTPAVVCFHFVWVSMAFQSWQRHGSATSQRGNRRYCLSFR